MSLKFSLFLSYTSIFTKNLHNCLSSSHLKKLPHYWSRIIISLKNWCTWAEALLLSETRLHFKFSISPSNLLPYFKHLIPMTSSPLLVSSALISSSLITSLCMLMSPLTFLTSTTSSSLSVRLTHSFISPTCRACPWFHHRNSHSPFYYSINEWSFLYRPFCGWICELCWLLHPSKLLSHSSYKHLWLLDLLLLPDLLISFCW